MAQCQYYLKNISFVSSSDLVWDFRYPAKALAGKLDNISNCNLNTYSHRLSLLSALLCHLGGVWCGTACLQHSRVN